MSSSRPSSPRVSIDADRSRGSLARQTLLQMALRVGLVIVAMTAVSYLHAIRSFTRQSVDDLGDYIHVRGEREQWIFDLALDNHKTIVTELLRRIHDYKDVDPDLEFDRRFVKLPDGTTRTRIDSFDPSRDASGTINRKGPLDTELKRRILATQDTIEQMGRAMHTRFQNTWMGMPENIGLAYWPEEPRWPFDIKGDIDFTTSAIPFATLQSDPEHKTVWTSVYRDRTSATLVSVVTPVYDGDRFLGALGHDMALEELLERTVNVKLEGTYNLIVQEDGTLIAHPELKRKIEEAEGRLNVSSAGDPDLPGIYRAAVGITGDEGVVEDESGRFYLGVMRLRGPGWFLITVHPKALLQTEASGVARFVLLAGLLSLLLEVGILYLVLRTRIAAPLRVLLGATERVAAGDMNVDLDTRRNDELGRLARSFTHMARAVRDREAHSRQVEETLRQSEERFRLLFERSADALLLLDEGRFTDGNEAAVRLLGCADRDELLSMRLADLHPEKQPDGGSSAEKMEAMIAAAHASGSHRLEWLAVRKDGEAFFAETLVTSIPSRDTSTMLYVVLRDVTERTRRDEQIRRLNGELTDLLQREREKNQMLERLRATVDVLSTPVLQVWKSVLALPLLGSIDERRSAVITEKLLAKIVERRARFVIIDITGVTTIDAGVAERLLKTVGAVRLLGARCILTGAGPAAARTLVSLDIDVPIATKRTMEDGLRACIPQMRLRGRAIA